MNIQIIKQFSKRTEYKMLKEWLSTQERNIEELMNGICVIPAIILLKLSETDLQLLNNWWRKWGNQLIVSPPYHQIDIVTLLQLNVDLSVQAIGPQSFNSFPVVESIKTNVKSKWELESGEVLAVDFFEHSGSGCLTLTTVPLLDYRLLSKKKNGKRLFLELINKKSNVESAKIQESFTLCPIHEYILLLSSANVLDTTNLSEQLNKYFEKKISNEKAVDLFQQLITQGFLRDSGEITSLGEKHIKLKGYWAFVREIKRWGYNNGAW